MGLVGWQPLWMRPPLYGQSDTGSITVEVSMSLVNEARLEATMSGCVQRS